MPPSATKAKSTYSVLLDKESQAADGKRKLKKSQSLNVHQHPHQEATSNLGISRNLFKSRDVFFGQKKPGSSMLPTVNVATANGVSTTALGAYGGQEEG